MSEDVSRLRRQSFRLLLAVLLCTATGSVFSPASADLTVSEGGRTFTSEHEVILPGDPITNYDVWNGDISGWWDHTFSDSPKALYIEARPGGRFMEIFDDEGNGVVHANVIYAERGKLLRMSGPLAFSGQPIEIVMNLQFEEHESGTLLLATINGFGPLEDGWAQAIDQVWHHFLFERLKPYVEAGKHLAGEPE